MPTHRKSKGCLLDHVDEVMDSSYGVKLMTDCPMEQCKGDFGLQGKVQNVPNIDAGISKARHKSSYCGLGAQLMQYSVCLTICSHHDLVHNLLK